MTKINLNHFEEALYEAAAVIREEFRSAIAECDDIDEACLAIREELRVSKPDFIKIIAYALAGEVLRGTR
jgi:hypothetical protein